jgi:hypothetical protein
MKRRGRSPTVYESTNTTDDFIDEQDQNDLVESLEIVSERMNAKSLLSQI